METQFNHWIKNGMANATEWKILFKSVPRSHALFIHKRQRNKSTPETDRQTDTTHTDKNSIAYGLCGRRWTHHHPITTLSVSVASDCLHNDWTLAPHYKQECIPVAVCWGVSASVHAGMHPHRGSKPRHPLGRGLDPRMWAWTPPIWALIPTYSQPDPPTSPGSGPRHPGWPDPQPPPWAWA